MKRTNNPDCGIIIDIILRNEIYATESLTDRMYQVGKNEAAITVQCDKDGNVKSAFCKHGSRYYIFKNPEDAKFVSDACKQRIIGQTREQQKIDSFNRKFR